MHSVRNELTKLILVGTRITYQATGDAGTCTININTRYTTNTDVIALEPEYYQMHCRSCTLYAC